MLPSAFPNAGQTSLPERLLTVEDNVQTASSYLTCDKGRHERVLNLSRHQLLHRNLLICIFIEVLFCPCEGCQMEFKAPSEI